MAYERAIARSAKFDQNNQCQITGEKKRLEAHSATRYHLVDLLTKKAADCVVLSHSAHRKIHEHANYLWYRDGNKGTASPEYVLKVTWEALNESLGGEALDRERKLKDKIPDSNKEKLRRQQKGLYMYMAGKYTISPIMSEMLEGNVKTQVRGENKLVYAEAS